jgi:hypothetical protein
MVIVLTGFHDVMVIVLTRSHCVMAIVLSSFIEACQNYNIYTMEA